MNNPLRPEAERRLHTGEAATTVAASLRLPLSTVRGWRKALGVTPKARGWVKDRPRRVTAAKVEADFLELITAWGAQVAHGLALTDKDRRHLTVAIRTSGELTDIAHTLTTVTVAIHSEAADALWLRLGRTPWAKAARQRLIDEQWRQGTPVVTDQMVAAKAERLRRLVTERVAALRAEIEAGVVMQSRAFGWDQHAQAEAARRRTEVEAGVVLAEWLLDDADLIEGTTRTTLAHWVRQFPLARWALRIRP